MWFKMLCAEYALPLCWCNGGGRATSVQSLFSEPGQTEPNRAYSWRAALVLSAWRLQSVFQALELMLLASWQAVFLFRPTNQCAKSQPMFSNASSTGSRSWRAKVCNALCKAMWIRWGEGCTALPLPPRTSQSNLGWSQTRSEHPSCPPSHLTHPPPP